ncbi:trace amine-associated receptor 9-like [Aplysia californica]|uniref:Trace amine-associated receptor 9-like n=1 Tax=Aplysia californica TaxID=6500 RepID=A0ABM0KAH9_APLCA|nr:trace amine-associated receptor 9-like [Aplysia californica]
MLVLKTPSIRTQGNALVASLAFTDVIMGVVYVIYSCLILTSTPSGDWHFFSDRFLVVFGSSLTDVSAVHMALIALDRYIFFVHPFVYMKRINKKLTTFVISGAWMFGVSLTGVNYIVYIAKEDIYATCNFSHTPLSYLYNVTFLIYLAVNVVAFVCYFRIARLIQQHRRIIAANREMVRSRILLTTSDPSAHSQDTSNISENHMKRLRILITTFSVFFVCKMTSLSVFGVEQYLTILPDVLVFIVLFFIPISSTVNFLLFTLMDKHFRRALTKMASCRC